MRNYQARNLLRDDLRVGDGVLDAFDADPAGVTGLAEIVRAGFPDPTAWKPGTKASSKSTRAAPVWFAVEIRFVGSSSASRSAGATLKATAGLEKMVVTQRGSRLSVQPVTGTEYNLVRPCSAEDSEPAGSGAAFRLGRTAEAIGLGASTEIAQNGGALAAGVTPHRAGATEALLDDRERRATSSISASAGRFRWTSASARFIRT